MEKITKNNITKGLNGGSKDGNEKVLEIKESEGPTMGREVTQGMSEDSGVVVKDGDNTDCFVDQARRDNFQESRANDDSKIGGERKSVVKNGTASATAKSNGDQRLNFHILLLKCLVSIYRAFQIIEGGIKGLPRSQNNHCVLRGNLKGCKGLRTTIVYLVDAAHI
ncbi:hypothetical protein SUGI_0579290 [Cryptomeria japonica]|nr:hypothetical protein SUGI_0579290 [Cryptomeria japonica]